MNTDTQWDGMSFYDESRFLLDGSDRPTPMLVDTRVGVQPYLHRPARGGSISLLLLLGPTGFVNVSIQYTNVIGSDVLDIMSASLGAGDSIIMDNAHIHYLSFRELPALEVTIVPVRQPTYSPDVQPVENVFGLIHQRVYAGNRQFASINELYSITIDRISEIIDIMINNGEDARLYHRLVLSMPNRIQRLIDLSGWPVN
jgi:transposase